MQTMKSELRPATALLTALSQKTEYFWATLLSVWSSNLAHRPSLLSCICKSVTCNCSFMISDVAMMTGVITTRCRTDNTTNNTPHGDEKQTKCKIWWKQMALDTVHTSTWHNEQKWFSIVIDKPHIHQLRFSRTVLQLTFPTSNSVFTKNDYSTSCEYQN